MNDATNIVAALPEILNLSKTRVILLQLIRLLGTFKVTNEL